MLNPISGPISGLHYGFTKPTICWIVIKSLLVIITIALPILRRVGYQVFDAIPAKLLVGYYIGIE